VNNKYKLVIKIISALLAVFVLLGAGYYFSGNFNKFSDLSLLLRSVVFGSAAAVIFLVFLVWIKTGSKSGNSYTAVTLEEIEVNEEELYEAVDNWVFFRHRKLREGRITFLEDDEGNVICRVMVRKDS